MDTDSVMRHSAAVLAAAQAARAVCEGLCQESAALRRDTAHTVELALAQVMAPTMDQLRRKARVYLRWVASGALAATEAHQLLTQDLLDAGLAIEPGSFLALLASEGV